MNDLENKNVIDEFGNWFNSQLGIETEPKQENQAQTIEPNYPSVKDGGTNINYANQDNRTTGEKFADFMRQNLF